MLWGFLTVGLQFLRFIWLGKMSIKLKVNTVPGVVRVVAVANIIISCCCCCLVATVVVVVVVVVVKTAIYNEYSSS